MANPTTFHTFTSLQAARDYRHTNGTGGWIFVPDSHIGGCLDCILFPPDFTPTNIFNHAFARGRSGQMVGN